MDSYSGQMNALDIRQLIGEATEYDKKLALEVKRPKSWCKSVSAFANGIGGKLIWGIADDDTLVGLADAKGDAERISEANKQGGQKGGQKGGQNNIDIILKLIKDNPATHK